MSFEKFYHRSNIMIVHSYFCATKVATSVSAFLYSLMPSA